MAKLTQFTAPRYWLTWLGIALLRLIAFLPFKPGLALGRFIGISLYHLLPKRRYIAEVNTTLCFPELNKDQQKQFVKKVFADNGIGVVETAWAFWSNKKSLLNKTTYVDLKLIDQALEQGKGLILLGGHYSTLDLGGALFSLKGYPLVSMYRRHNNPLMEEIICRGRSSWSDPIERKQLRQIVRKLRNNHIVWYGPDQDFGRKNAVFVPFFKQTAATITATSKMVRLNDSPILCLRQRRNDDDSGYTISVAPIEGFPSGDETEDARLMNLAIEQAVRQAPSQYMWVHRRFKTQPDQQLNPYQQR
ncbi:LpxL/LpxP family Kdo(2)-lipid IV(A) lauroyl/palmitoleoyl acyltransferase [uncultured Neptuniibacter sp.]|uniref:LpxL/LpxP family Kdo(2)-lipid IV(A) lauroyl/palmitoleoyl acyltransferase n=1 Tax=uncultured Neptuniibacter sp. TaxID=502143 RepID=UPI00260AD968|nr:LpxL/LpxP family Kdo(2)-lipid IV(A) lauroyl/palmitoleoyl acyltransferase [uncultured Neptuniibacter sp.]